MRSLVLHALLLCLAVTVDAARLSPSDMTMHIEMQGKVFRVYEDISFSVIITPQKDGEILTWETTEVHGTVYQASSTYEGETEEEVLTFDLDERVENSVVVVAGGFDPNTGFEERGFSTYPDAQEVSLVAGASYSRKLSFVGDVYPVADEYITLLKPGEYRLEITYALADYREENYDEHPHKSAEVFFKITTEGAEEESLNYWVDILLDEGASRKYVLSAWDALDYYTDQAYRYSHEDSMDMVARVKASYEYVGWWQHHIDDLELELIDGHEFLIRSTDYCYTCYRGPIVLINGESEFEVSEESVVLSGKLELGFAGLRELVVKNNRLAGKDVIATRTGYDEWTAAIPLEEGENSLTIIATDFIYNELETVIEVRRLDK